MQVQSSDVGDNFLEKILEDIADEGAAKRMRAAFTKDKTHLMGSLGKSVASMGIRKLKGFTKTTKGEGKGNSK